MTSPSTDSSLLRTYLTGQRRHVIEALEGLDEDAMHRSVLPSGWSPVQLVHHLAVDDERFWVRLVIAGDGHARSELSDNGWEVPTSLAAADVLDLYRTEAALSDAVLAGADLDAAPAWWPDFMGERWIVQPAGLLHLIVETRPTPARRRASSDGKQWVVIT